MLRSYAEARVHPEVEANAQSMVFPAASGRHSNQTFPYNPQQAAAPVYDTYPYDRHYHHEVMPTKNRKGTSPLLKPGRRKVNGTLRQQSSCFSVISYSHGPTGALQCEML